MKQLTISDIFEQANIKCEDTIDSRTLLRYFNEGVINVNSYCNLQLPTLTAEDLKNNSQIVYEATNDIHANDILSMCLTNFIAYTIRKNEGYPMSDITFYSDYVVLRNQFKNSFYPIVKEEYKIPQELDFSVKKGNFPNIRFTKRGLY